MRSSQLSVDAVAAPSTENLENRRSKLDGVDAVDQKTYVCTTYEKAHAQQKHEELLTPLWLTC
jgi:hypothetical protein